MNDNVSAPSSIDFQVDQDNLFREETITDLKIATIRKMIPIKPDGSDDDDRDVVFIGAAQIGTPQGPVPIEAILEAANFKEAMTVFPFAMEEETKNVVAHFKRLNATQKKAKASSPPIVPGIQ